MEINTKGKVHKQFKEHVEQKGYTGLEKRKFVPNNDGLRTCIMNIGQLFKTADLSQNDYAAWGDVKKALREYPIGYSGSNPRLLKTITKIKQTEQYLVLDTDCASPVVVKKSDRIDGKTRKRKFYQYKGLGGDPKSFAWRRQMSKIGSFCGTITDSEYQNITLPTDTIFAKDGTVMGQIVPDDEVDIDIKAAATAHQI